MGVVPAQDAPVRKRERSVSPERARDFEPEYIKAEKLLIMLYAQGLCPASALSMDDFSDELNREIAGMLLSGKKPSAIMDALDEDKRGRAAGHIATDGAAQPGYGRGRWSPIAWRRSA